MLMIATGDLQHLGLNIEELSQPSLEHPLVELFGSKYGRRSLFFIFSYRLIGSPAFVRVLMFRPLINGMMWKKS